MAHYLGSKELLGLIFDSEFDFEESKPASTATYSDMEGFKPVSTDSYSDEEVYNSIKKLNALKPLCLCAIQTAVVGDGNKTYGEFTLKDEKVDVRSLYKEYGVKDDLTQNVKLNPGDLTPRRLQTFYRANIHKYLENNTSVEPYLWKKYSTLDTKYRSITFPGAESLIDNKDEAEYLLDTYKCLDERLGTNDHERAQSSIESA
ncbi:hypothetical protein BG000_011459 [Podila horticola]|nr:hypothetical protein BG000_011459 [Podila horticola]